MRHKLGHSCCILSKFYIKPQQCLALALFLNVVSYRNSTSNHNNAFATNSATPLYLIEILHQTTTCGKCDECLRRCILSKFYIKPQLEKGSAHVTYSCILSKFYIKPQPPRQKVNKIFVVSYRNSTSNHNSSATFTAIRRLYLIEILHQTTTSGSEKARTNGCILSKFYIKPQHEPLAGDVPGVVSYRNSTSNHNFVYSFFVQHVVVSYRNSTSNHNRVPIA